MQPGENVLNVGMFRLARMAQVGCAWKSPMAMLPCAFPRAGTCAQKRPQVEEQLGSIRLARDVFYPEHAVGFHLGPPPASSTPQRPQAHGDACQARARSCPRSRPLPPGQ